MNSKYAFFTIDVESFSDTECVAGSGYCSKDDMLDGLQTYIDVLNKYNIKATMFTLKDVASKYKGLLSEFISGGHKLALHGNRHVPMIDMPLSRFKRETIHAKNVLEDIFGVKVRGFRAPFFSMDRARLDILQSLGFLYDSSLTEFSHARHTTPVNLDGFSNPQGRIFVKDGFYEFGNSMEKVFDSSFPISGGGYMRLSPWFFSGSLLGKHLKRNDYYMFYLHPFELSNHKMPYIKNLKIHDMIYLYSGISGYKTRLERIIDNLTKEGYTFSTFEDVAEENMFNQKTE